MIGTSCCAAAAAPLDLEKDVELQNIQEWFGNLDLKALCVCGCVVCCGLEGSECVNGSIVGRGLKGSECVYHWVVCCQLAGGVGVFDYVAGRALQNV